MDETTAAVRRFPHRAKAIDELAGQKDWFKDLCVEFGLAEAELIKWTSSQDPLREERMSEYLVLVTELAKEIEAAIAAAAVVPFPRR